MLDMLDRLASVTRLDAKLSKDEENRTVLLKRYPDISGLTTATGQFNNLQYWLQFQYRRAAIGIHLIGSLIGSIISPSFTQMNRWLHPIDCRKTRTWLD